MTNDSEPLTGYATWLLTRTANHAHRIVGQRLADTGARGYHFRVLLSLSRLGPASQADLGRRSGIHLSDMVATLNELGESGHIERSPDPTDRRRNVITITEAGRTRLDELGKQIDIAQDELLEPLSPDDRAVLRTVLTRLLDHHDPPEPGAPETEGP